MSREITPSLSQFEPKEMQPGMFLIGLRRHPPDLPPKLRLGRSSVHSSAKLTVKTVESVAGLLIWFRSSSGYRDPNCLSGNFLIPLLRSIEAQLASLQIK